MSELSTVTIIETNDRCYNDKIEAVKVYASKALAHSQTIVFKADLDVYPIYLDAVEKEFGSAVRQEYTCNSCHQFIRDYGGLVEILANGRLNSLVWPDIEEGPFSKVFSYIREKISKARIAHQFIPITHKPIWGIKANKFNHFHLDKPASINIYRKFTSYRSDIEKASKFIKR